MVWSEAKRFWWPGFLLDPVILTSCSQKAILRVPCSFHHINEQNEQNLELAEESRYQTIL